MYSLLYHYKEIKENSEVIFLCLCAAVNAIDLSSSLNSLVSQHPVNILAAPNKFSISFLRYYNISQDAVYFVRYFLRLICY